MKRILCVLLVLGLMLSFVGCKKDMNRELYNLNLEKYVELGDYMSIRIDTTTEDFKKINDQVIAYDVQSNLFYKGTVAKGDVVNIDYIGKKDGVAFEGGTAQGYDLTIGSGTFIPGFEEGLIGAKVGTIVTLPLTFPKEYHSEELAGAKVEFTVKINYTDKKIAQEPKEYYKKLNYKTLEDYLENVKERAIEETIINKALEICKVEKYSEKDMDILYDYYYKTIENNVKTSYNMTMEQYFEAIKQTEEEFKTEVIDGEIKPLMDQQMVWYAILDKEGLTVTDEDIDAKIKEILADSGDTSATRADVIDQLGEIYLENIVVSEKVFDLLKSNSAIS
jgi:trigger factor